MPKHYPYYYGPPPPTDPFEGYMKIHKMMRRQEEVRLRKEEEEKKKKGEKDKEKPMTKKVFSVWQLFLILTALGPIVGPITLVVWLQCLTLLRDVLLTNLK